MRDRQPGVVSLGDRFRGLMVGIAVGDALGRPVEGRRRVPESYLEEIVTRPPSMIYTDDTAMSIWLAESLLARDGFDGAHMARRFADGYRQEPYRGYGRNIVDVFDRVDRGVPWETASAMQFEGSGSYGNGAAMRVAPVALWAHPDLDQVVQLARDTASVTHTHPVGVEGAVVQAVACHHSLGESFDQDALLDRLGGLIETGEFRHKLKVLAEALEHDDDEYARTHLGNWVAADNSVLTALYCLLLGDGFEDTVVRAIRLGGDVDTIASMAAALAGARYGLSAILRVWRDVEGYETLTGLADEMFARVEGLGS